MSCVRPTRWDDYTSILECLDTEDAFRRDDENPDDQFYSRDRMVAHLDAVALRTTERILGALVREPAPAVLDLMASWDSHLPETVTPSRLVGLGMNERELAANPRLTERVVQDLNRDPVLPFADHTFDVVLNTVSVDYLTRPVEVFREAARVLKPGGLFVVLFSNRYFPTKAVKIWKEASEKERIELVAEYLRRAEGFDVPGLNISMGKPRPSEDKYAHLGLPSDPVFAVWAEKKGGAKAKVRTIPDDPECAMGGDEEFRRRMAEVKHTGRCPHCGEKLSKWKVPADPNIEWDTEYMYICLNDACPFLVRGWGHLFRQGITGTSYRFVYIKERDCGITVPVHSLHDLKDGVVEDEAAWAVVNR